MQEYLVQGSLHLTRSSVLRIEDGRGILVYLWEGELWVTEDGERSDRILRPGQWHRLARNGTGLCYALQRSVVTLTAPKPAGFARRIVLQRAGSAEPAELYHVGRERRQDLRARLKRFWTGLVRPLAFRTSGV